MIEDDELREILRRLSLVVRHMVTLGEEWDTEKRIEHLDIIDRLIGIDPQDENDLK